MPLHGYDTFKLLIFDRYKDYFSSVSIVTDYRLDGPGSNPGGDEVFRPSIPALGPTQPGPGAHPASCTMGTGSLQGGKVRPGRAADHSPPSSAAVVEE